MFFFPLREAKAYQNIGSANFGGDTGQLLEVGKLRRVEIIRVNKRAIEQIVEAKARAQGNDDRVRRRRG